MSNPLAILQSDRAANSFEYLLVIGVIVVPFVAALIAGFALVIPEVAQYVCPAVDTADPAAAPGSCIPGF
jgi:hypothetical protein